MNGYYGLKAKYVRRSGSLLTVKVRQWAMILFGLGGVIVSSMMICHYYSIEPTVVAAMFVVSILLLQAVIAIMKTTYMIIKGLLRTITLIRRYQMLSLPIIIMIVLTLFVLGLMTRELLPF